MRTALSLYQVFTIIYSDMIIGTLLSEGGQEGHVFGARCLLPFLAIRAGAY